MKLIHFRKTLVLVFLVTNLFVVSYVNIYNWIVTYSSKSELISLQSPRPIQWMNWVIRTYSYHLGIDNIWEMFSYAHRINWNLEFYGVNKFNREITLPLPRQSDRTFLDKTFFDFREAKYYLNLYNNNILLDRFSNFLCQKYSDKHYFNKIRIYLVWNGIANREIAKKTEVIFGPEIKQKEREFKCL